MARDKHLVMKPEVFQILLRLLEGDSHGYQIMQDVAASTNGEVRMLAGALYRHLKRLLDAGLIAESAPGDGADADDRRRCYTVTAAGRTAAAAEARRLERLVAAARAHDLIGA